MIRNIVFATLFAVGMLLTACSSNTSAKKSALDGENLCIDVTNCPKACNGDSDCDQANGQLCCNYPGYGGACVPAVQCPVFCLDGNDCLGNQSGATACCRTRSEAAEMVCAPPQACITFCPTGQNSECSAPGTICCTSLTEPRCMPAAECFQQCTASTDCNTGQGDICCPNAGEIKGLSYLLGAAYCIPSGLTCPKACTQAAECDTTIGEVCCPDGFCNTSCLQTCAENTDCNTMAGQACCETQAIHSPWL